MPAPPRTARHGHAYWLFLFFLCQIASAGPARAQEPAAESDDLFAEGTWHLELGVLAATEAWNYNESHEDLIGGTIGATYGFIENFALILSVPLYYIRQRGPDAWLPGTTCGVRWRALARRRVAMFLELEVGVSYASLETPPRGTRFNFLALGGGGVTTRIAPGVHLLAGIKVVHISNAGIAGPRRNPDTDAVGARISILTRF